MPPGFSLKKLFGKGSGPSERQPRTIRPGMRYKQQSQLESVWVVKRLVNGIASDLPHAIIAREESENDTRLIAVSTLRDSDYFRYLPPPEEKEKESKAAE